MIAAEMAGIGTGAAAAMRPPRAAVMSDASLWAAALTLAALVIALQVLDFAFDAPSQSLVPVADAISAAMAWFTGHFRAAFRAITWLFQWPLGWFRQLLLALPWPVVILITAALGYRAGGFRLAWFCALALFYIVITGYWPMAAATLASVLVAVPLSVAVGLAVGIAAFRSRTVRQAVEPMLDLMQTIPFFSYIIPILVLFGIGPVVGLVASAIYAIPPMVRNVVLALQRVPPDVVESGLMSGSTVRQLLWWVELPTGLPTILIGVNQTVMAALSMVVIAAMVGGVNDIGLEVYNTMREAKFGQSLLSGLVIALIAMVTDRITRGFAHGGEDPGGTRRTRLFYGVVAIGVVALVALAIAFPALWTFPESARFYPAAAMNAALDWFTRTAFPVTSALKAWTVYYLMLPFKIGLPASVRPSFWGFAMSPTVTIVFTAIAAALTFLALWLKGWRAAIAVAVLASFYYFGTTGLPWPAVIIVASALALSTGGLRIAVITLLSLLFILVNGMWAGAMVSVQLAAIGVLFSFLIGAALGIWAALNDRVSAVLRPICDTLQTMPIFVFLIPAIMVFLVGEFTALIATILYAIVPSIRYTEHGLRSVPPEIVEAARAMGTGRLQRLRQVELPLALPEIMLGLNQTIMMALAMVVVAALVGARGLGEQVMIALNQANTGTGLVSGLAIALIAIASDRIIQSWAARRKEALGLG
jgi:glycine betaine/proline transport system permease protein